MAHHHHHHGINTGWILQLSLVATLAFTAFEVFAGFYSQSKRDSLHLALLNSLKQNGLRFIPLRKTNDCDGKTMQIQAVQSQPGRSRPLEPSGDVHVFQLSASGTRDGQIEVAVAFVHQ